MSSGVRAIALFLLLTAATSASAGIIFVPVGGRYLNPELAATTWQPVPGEPGSFVLETQVLAGVLTFDCSQTPACRPGMDGAEVPFTERLELTIDTTSGEVVGRSSGRLDGGQNLDFTAEVEGTATCVENGNGPCGQVLVDLVLRGMLFDPRDPSRVGRLRTQAVGSFVTDGESAEWGALSATGTLGLVVPD